MSCEFLDVDSKEKLAKILPSEYRYEIDSSFQNKFENSNNFQVKLRVALKSEADGVKWLKAFEQNSNTKYIKARTNQNRSCSNSTRDGYLWSTDYECHHSNRNKGVVQTDGNFDSHVHKATACSSSLNLRVSQSNIVVVVVLTVERHNVKVKRQSHWVTYKDSFAKRDLWGIVLLKKALARVCVGARVYIDICRARFRSVAPIARCR